MSTSLSTQPHQNLRADQAQELRALVAKQKDSSTLGPSHVRQCHSLAIAGGKGGVGRSVIALNLAIGLAQRGASVGLIDASQDLGSIELLCGLNSYWNLSHVAQGSRQVGEVVQTGPAGIRILSGASCLVDSEMTHASVRKSLLAQLKTFEQELDWLIIDGSGGAGGLIQKFSLAADDVIDHCRNQIAGYKCPRSVDFRDTPLPLSGAGKVLKRELREPYWKNFTEAVN